MGCFWGCDEKFPLVIQKGEYTYDYMDGWEKLEEASLLLKDAFYSRFNMKGISDQDLEHAQQVWNIMEKKTLCYFQRNLVKNRCFAEAFRNTCLKNYKLDPADF